MLADPAVQAPARPPPTGAGLAQRADDAAGSLFAQDWWLDVAAPGAWHRVEVRWSGVTVGSMAFSVHRRWGLTFLQMPPLTRTLSPVLRPPGGTPAHMLLNRVRILEALLQQLPPHDRLELGLQPDSDCALPFVMLNYPVAHTYTFVATQADGLRQRMHQKTRNVVNKAARDFHVVSADDPDYFLHLLRVQRGAALQQDIGTVRRLYEAAHSRGQAMVLRAINGRSQDGGCAILVWDAQRLYYWLSARDPAESSNGALSLLIAEAAQQAASMGRIFDMDGWGTQRSGTFLAKFGFTPVVRGYVNHGSARWKLLHCLSSSVRGLRDDRHYRF